MKGETLMAFGAAAVLLAAIFAVGYAEGDEADPTVDDALTDVVVSDQESDVGDPAIDTSDGLDAQDVSIDEPTPVVVVEEEEDPLPEGSDGLPPPRASEPASAPVTTQDHCHVCPPVDEVEDEADVTVEKSGETILREDPFVDEARFFIDVLSIGNATAENVVLTDELPDLFGDPWFVSGPDKEFCDLDGLQLTCEFGDLEPGETRSIVVETLACQFVCTDDVANEAFVTADNDANPDNNQDSAILDFEECPFADVEADKEADLFLSEEPGEDLLTYTITVTNIGTATAEHVTLVDHLPDIQGHPWFLDGADAVDCEIAGGNELTCDFGDLEPGESRQFTVTSLACDFDCDDVIENEVWVFADNDKIESNNHDNVTVVTQPCPFADVVADKEADLTLSDNPGEDLLSYTITVTNIGTGVAEDVTLVDHLPDIDGHPWFVDGADAEDCEITGGTELACDFGDLEPGDVRQIIVTSLACDFECDEVIENEVWVFAANDIDDSNNHDNVTVETPPCPVADVLAEKEADLTLSDNPGEDLLTYTITVTNIGDGVAEEVTLVDHLPDIQGHPWFLDGADAVDCEITGGNELTCDFGDLEPGESRQFTVTSLACDFDCDDVIFNEVWVFAANDVDDSNNHDNVTVVTQPCPGDVAVDKEADLDLSEEPGLDQLTYFITVTSVGTGTATDVTLVDHLPSLDGNVWTLGGADAEFCDVDGDELTCDFGDLESGEVRSISVQSLACDLACEEEIFNEVWLFSTNDQNDANNHDNVTVVTQDCPPAEADVEADKEGELVFREDGADEVIYTITVTNLGPGVALNVDLVDHLPDLDSPWALGGADADDCNVDGNELTCDFGDLDVGEVRQITVSAFQCQIDCEDVIRNEVWVFADNDPNEENNHDSVTLEAPECPPEEADVEADKEGELVFNAGAGADEVIYTITVTNLGPGIALNVDLVDHLPSLGSMWTLGGADADDCNVDGNELTCDFGDLDVGEVRQITVSAFECHIDCDDVIENEVWVFADNDPNEENNHDSVTLTAPECPGDAEVGKEVETTQQQGFDIVDFTITVTNVGEGTVTDVVLTDNLPDLDVPWTVGGADAADCDLEGLLLTCSFGDLDAGEVRQVIVSSALCVIGCEDIANTASITAGNDNNPANDQDTVILEGRDCPDVAVDKESEVDDGPGFDTLTYFFTVSNIGGDTATGVVLSDNLPDLGSPWEIGGADAADCTIEGGTLVCDFGTLNAGEDRHVWVTAFACELGCEDIVNTATVSADFDIDNSNNSDTDVVEREC